MSRMRHVALGFRAHSGWAAMVAVSGPASSPRVIDRRRTELADLAIPRPVQPYHAAESLELEKAREIVGRAAKEARVMARQAFRDVTAHLREDGHEVVACGILLGSGRSGASLAKTLASHALIHTAEGELFRGAIAGASKHFRVPVTGVKEREIYTRGAEELRLSLKDLPRRLAELGHALGPPWGQDQKLTALVAWLALAAQSR